MYLNPMRSFCPEASPQEAPQVFIFIWIFIFISFFSIIIHILTSKNRKGGAPMDRIIWSTPFFVHPLNITSSMAKAFLPQSPQEVIAIPLMNSPIANDIECLQFGHLYCWVDFI